MLLKLDPKEDPGSLGEAEFNLAIVNAIDPGNATARVIRGELNRKRREAADRSAVTANAADSHTGEIP
jgi:hypothetical protein